MDINRMDIDGRRMDVDGRATRIFRNSRRGRVNVALVAAVAAVVLGAACGGSTTTVNNPVAASTVVVPTTTVSFLGTLPVGGAAFYSFNLLSSGTVTVTLVSVQGAFVAPTVMLALGVGTPNGTTCAVSGTPSNASAGPSPQLTVTDGPGVFCVNISDPGNLIAPANFDITITYPSS
jgi:hypothetical protein